LVDLRGMISVVRTRFLLIIAGVLVAVAFALILSLALPPVYESEATMIVGQSLTSANPDTTQLQASQQLAQTYALVATTRPNLQAVIEELRLRTTPDELQRNVSVTAPLNETLLTITAQDRNAQRAAQIANALAAQLLLVSPQVQGRQADVQTFIDNELNATQTEIEQVQSQVQTLLAIPALTQDQDQQLQALQTRLDSLRATYAQLLASSPSSAANLLSVVEPAVPANAPSSPRVLLNVVLAAIVGLLLSLGLVFLVDYLDDTVKTAQDVELTTELPVLGSIRRFGRDARRGVDGSMGALVNPRSEAAEAFRQLRVNVDFTSIDRPIRLLLVTSPLTREGKTTVASNLAVAFAHAGRRTLLVDADLRAPAVHLVFDFPNSSGLTDLMRVPDASFGSIKWHQTSEPLLSVLPSGPLPPDPAGLIGSERMQRVLGWLAGVADLVILDSAPLIVSDATVLAARADATLLVFNSGHTRRATARQAREALSRVGARAIGVVLNRMPKSGEERSYSAYYRYLDAKQPPAGPGSGTNAAPTIPDAQR